MKTYEIKQIPILEVMDKLGIRYFKKTGGEYGIYEDGEKTSGRGFNIHKNIINDFSKDRSSGDVFGFVKNYINLQDKEVFRWFEDNFGIEGQKKPIRIIRNGLEELKEEQIKYLVSRGIKYALIKKHAKLYKGGIACLVYEDGTPKGINTRTLSSQKNKRFVGMKGYSTKGIYMGDIEEGKPIIVVEGLIDFLTLSQFYINVVGLKSAESGVDEVKKLSKNYDIIFIPDIDEAGQKTKDKFTFKHSIFDLSKYGDYKDINDMHKDFMSKDIVDGILDEAKIKLPIDISFEKFNAMQEIIKKNGKLGIDGPLNEIYNHTQGVIPGKVYTIGAFSNVGKSKFAYYHTQYFLKKGKSVLFINLEVDEAMCLGNIICSAEKTTFGNMIKGYNPDKSIYQNLTIRDDLYKIEDISECIEVSKADIVFIDFVQNIQSSGSDYERHSKIAREIQRLAIQTGSTIFSLSQLSNSVGKEVNRGNTDFVSLKGSGEYYASSDVIFIIRRSGINNMLELKIQKNKYGRNGLEFNIGVDYETSQFSIIKDIDNIGF